jgi:hypothetical protein
MYIFVGLSALLLIIVYQPNIHWAKSVLRNEAPKWGPSGIIIAK